MDPISMCKADQISAWLTAELTPNQVEAMYLNWRNNNILVLPMLSGTISIEEWRERELRSVL